MWLAAADAPPAPADSLIIAIFTFLGVVVTTVGVIVVQAIKSKAERTGSAPPAATDTALLVSLAERTAVHGQRLDDSDERDDYQDRAIKTLDDEQEAHRRRIEALERHHDRLDEGWRQ